MSLFTPTYCMKKVTDVTEEFLNKNGFKGIILDIDDTLTPNGHPEPDKEVSVWINQLKSVDIKIILVSNNFKSRVDEFASKLNVLGISMGFKPFPKGIIKAIKILKISPEQVLMIGDQVFTDIVGANLLKIKSILVEPMSPSKTLLLKIKRFFEKPVRRKFRFKK